MPQARKKSPPKNASLPELIYAQASPRSIGGTSLFDAGTSINSANVNAFFSEGDVTQAAVVRLQQAGFQVLQVTAATINIAGPPAAYEQIGAQLVTESRTVAMGDGSETTKTIVDSQTSSQPGLIDTSGSPLGDVVEGIAIEEPVIYFENAFPPPAKYWHLDVPADVSLGVNADLAHRGGTTGRGVKVVMVDTGWYRHPFFTRRGYRSAPVVLAPGAANPLADEHGHGTGESANIFAAAPDVNFIMVKQSPVNATASFNSAVALAPQVISCSWGFDIEKGPLGAAQQALAAAVATAVASGIVVVFSAGNGHFGFPGSHPDVISAGGVYMKADGSVSASDYASGFASKVYPGRNVPDVSGLVGMRPKAIYIMLPLQAGDTIDVGNAGGTHPAGDETAANDGWGAFSGTSAAAPQIAGVCALLKQACPKLRPADIRDILKKTARDVSTGVSSQGNAAKAGPDLATGHGLVDAGKAVLAAKVRCMAAIPPVGPIGPSPLQAPADPIAQPLSEDDILALEELIVRGEGEL